MYIYTQEKLQGYWNRLDLGVILFRDSFHDQVSSLSTIQTTRDYINLEFDFLTAPLNHNFTKFRLFWKFCISCVESTFIKPSAT
jgi:hypothetical protein